MVTHTRTHVKVGFANPFLVCTECNAKVRYWHDPTRCFCDTAAFNYFCGHQTDTVSLCPTWSPVDGCRCKDKEKHA